MLTYEAFFLWPEYILYVHLSQTIFQVRGKKKHAMNFWYLRACSVTNQTIILYPEGKDPVSEKDISTGFKRTSQKLEQKKKQNSQLNEQSLRQERKAER